MTVDIGALSWMINPDHLVDGAADRVRCDLERSSARVAVVDDFLVAGVASGLARFLAQDATFDHEHGLYSVDGAVPRDAWEAADESDRLFRYGRLVGVSEDRRLDEDVLTYLQFRAAFQQPACRGYFEEISGMALAGSDDVGAHRMAAGDYLRPHSDDNRDRALAIVLYLSPGWEPDWGGQLVVVDREGGAMRIDARYNRLVLFDVAVGTSHAVAPITDRSGGAARYTIGGWYHRSEGGGG